MATAPPYRAAVLHLATPEHGLRLVDVEGKLEDGAIMRWSQVFKDAIEEDATGIAVDLRGCGAVDASCLSVLLAASSTLRARGGGGVTLVTTADSPLGLKMRTLAADELPAYPTASRALLSLRDGAE
jgi:anti-anti-sigma regulatory factor